MTPPPTGSSRRGKWPCALLGIISVSCGREEVTPRRDPSGSQPIDMHGKEVQLVDSSNYPLDRYAPVAINNGPVSYFLVDTAAALTTIDPRLGFAGKGRAPLNVAGGTVTQSFFPATTVAVGDARVADLVLSVLPLHWGPSVLGQLGSDFLSRFVVEFDYKHNRLRFYDPALYRNDGPSVALSLADSIPHVHMSIQMGSSKPVAGWFTLDSGFQGDVLLSSGTVREGAMEPYFDGSRVQKDAAGGDVMMKTSSTSGDASIGVNSIKGLQMVWADLQAQKPEDAGLIGAGMFTRFVVVLDYSNKKLWLSPNQP